MKKRKTDALIIGSGVGGLCTAARLAHSGLKVHVVERLSYIGGRFSTRDIKGCKITTGAIMVPISKGTAFAEVFDMMGAPFNVRESKGGFCYRLAHGDLEVPPQGGGGSRSARSQGGGLVGMMQFAMKDKARAAELLGHFRRASAWMEPGDSITFKEWLSQYTDHREVHNMMQGFCGAFVGIGADEVSAGEFFRFLKEMGRGHKYGIAVNGNRELMESLAGAITQKGGTVETGTKCKNILVEKGRAVGAIIETGSSGTGGREHKPEEIRVDADFIISNTGPERTIKLAGKDQFEKSYIAMLNEHPHATPVFHVAIISKEPLHDFEGIFNFGNTKNLIFMESPTITCPELAPDGGHITTTFSIAESSEGPVTHKIRKQSVKNIFKEIKDNFPRFQADRDTALVYAHHGQWPAMRRWPGYPMPVKTPVENLYNVGDGCMPPGTVGLEACAITAKIVAKDILKITQID